MRVKLMTNASIVFRQENLINSGKIYVDTFDGAAELAAKYRNSCHIVDVINHRDEVALR